MFKLLFLDLAIVALGQSAQPDIGLGSFTKGHPKVDPRIVNGVAAKEGQFPHQVSLQLVGPLLSSHYCGGEILSASTILTAGHCVTEVNIGVLQHIEVVAGSITITPRGNNAQVSKVTRTIVNPDFPGGVAPNDVAIHILTTRLVLNELVNIINLPVAGAIASGTAVLSGWGSTSHTQIPSMPNTLQTVELPIVPYDECAAAVEGLGTPFDDTMVCTGPLSGGYGACSGDSGGPLIINNTLVGVVSWGFIPCGQAGVPSVFTDPARHLDFINSNIVY